VDVRLKHQGETRRDRSNAPSDYRINGVLHLCQELPFQLRALCFPEAIGLPTLHRCSRGGDSTNFGDHRCMRHREKNRVGTKGEIRSMVDGAPTVSIQNVEDGREHWRVGCCMLSEMHIQERRQIVAEVRMSCKAQGMPRWARALQSQFSWHALGMLLPPSTSSRSQKQRYGTKGGSVTHDACLGSIEPVLLHCMCSIFNGTKWSLELSKRQAARRNRDGRTCRGVHATILLNRSVVGVHDAHEDTHASGTERGEALTASVKTGVAHLEQQALLWIHYECLHYEILDRGLRCARERRHLRPRRLLLRRPLPEDAREPDGAGRTFLTRRRPRGSAPFPCYTQYTTLYCQLGCAHPPQVEEQL